MERGRREGKEPILDEQPTVKRGSRREEELDEHREMDSLIKEIDGSRSQREEIPETSSSSSSSLSTESRMERVQDPRSQNQLPLVASYNQQFSQFQPEPFHGGGVNLGQPLQLDHGFNHHHPPTPSPSPQLWVNPPQLWFNHLPPPPLWFNPPPPPPPPLWVNPQQAGTGFFHPRPATENRVVVHQDGYNHRGSNYGDGSRRPPPLGRAAAARSCSNQIGRHSWRPRGGR